MNLPKSSTLAASDAVALFGSGGPLARAVAGFTPRPAQARMAQAVNDAIAERRRLVIEAPTGVGKTYAYLAPALLSGKRVVVSTGTKNLQDQLFHRDLPRLLKALRVPVRVSLLKGRSNYLCRHRLQRSLAQPGPPVLMSRLHGIEAWSRRTSAGELAEVAELADNDPLVPRITASHDNCLGGRCPAFDRCFVVQARRAAQSAELVVVNHSLLFADFVLKGEGFGEILPGADAIIVDEAHQLPELAGQFFGIRLSSRQLADLAQDVVAEARRTGDLPDLTVQAEILAQRAADWGDGFARLGGRAPFEAFMAAPGVAAATDALHEALEALNAALDPVRDRSADWSALHGRARELAARLDALLREDGEDAVRWAEPMGRGGVAAQAPLDLAGPLGAVLDAHAGAWVFTSATLSVGDDFSHFCGRMGLADADTLRLDSPFDFARQVRLYLPRGLPDPNADGYTERVVAVARPVIEASGGGAFLLCTSRRAVAAAAALLRRTEFRLPLFVQGEAPRAELLENFAAAGDGVLIGTSSFWEGVDVRGQALRVVVIDRLPFAAPGDPMLDARLKALRAHGRDPFLEYQLPAAITLLRQGAGRLIRDSDDRGLLMLCDPRLKSRGYGARVLASLPEMPVLENEAAAVDWAQALPRA